jgi:hypothetical protein
MRAPSVLVQNPICVSTAFTSSLTIMLLKQSYVNATKLSMYDVQKGNNIALLGGAVWI